MPIEERLSNAFMLKRSAMLPNKRARKKYIPAIVRISRLVIFENPQPNPVLIPKIRIPIMIPITVNVAESIVPSEHLWQD